jgi:hypothetical protein
LLAARCALAAAVAALLASGASLTRTRLRAAEYVLFLGLSLLLMSSQYFVGLDLMRRGPENLPILVAFIKDGVIQMMALMAIYGTLIPNPPAVAVRALAAIFAVPVATTFLLKLHPDAAQYVAQLGTAEEAGSNLLFLAIGGRWPCTAPSSSTTCGPNSTRPASSASIGWSGRSGPGGWARSTSPSTRC